MPRHRPALSNQEIGHIERWVEQGTPWPSAQQPDSLLDKRLEQLSNLLFSPYGYALIAGLGAAWIVWRCRRDARRAEAAGNALPAWGQWLARLSYGWILACVLAAWLGSAWTATQRLQTQVVRLESRPNPNEISFEQVLGSPPKVLHPGHPPRLKTVYYRGNCERSPLLFNHGNYRTCVLHIALCDREGNSLTWGDPVPKSGLAIRFEIERAPGATPQLFSDGIMAGVFVSVEHFQLSPKPRTNPISVLKPVVPNERWAALYPIAPAPTDRECTGRLYVHSKGIAVQGDEAELAAQCHYGIEYKLKLADGRIAEGSQIWANAIYLTSVVQWPTLPAEVPFNQWFDVDPIPVITGPNSTDPKLLGIPDHAKAPK